MQRTVISIRIEGEAYRSRGAEVDDICESEVLDVAADARVILRAKLGRAAEKDGYKIKDQTKDKRERHKLEVQFEELE